MNWDEINVLEIKNKFECGIGGTRDVYQFMRPETVSRIINEPENAITDFTCRIEQRPVRTINVRDKKIGIVWSPELEEALGKPLELLDSLSDDNWKMTNKISHIRDELSLALNHGDDLKKDLDELEKENKDLRESVKLQRFCMISMATALTLLIMNHFGVFHGIS